MSKVLLRYSTDLGPRTVVVEVGDTAAGYAVMHAHSAAFPGTDCPSASVVEEMPRLSLKDHMAKHKRSRPKPAKLAVVPAASNVTPLPRRRP